MMPEFPSHVLDSLRQPLEAGEAVIARANRHVRYPARFQLIAAMNPCRCGGGPGAHACTKGPRCAQSYQSRISGPFLDRVDLFYETPAVTAIDLSLPPPSEGTFEVKARIAHAREVAIARYGETPDAMQRPVNADAPGNLLEKIAAPDAAGAALLADAAEKLRLSARAFIRVQRVARTIADLEGATSVKRIHLAEALTYRHRPPGQPEPSQPPNARAARTAG